MRTMATITKAELEKENAQLWETLESVYDQLGEMIEGGSDEDEPGEEED